MSVWSPPITWANGAVTASQMNSLRDNLAWLKGALDLITESTAADTGTATKINVKRAAGTDKALEVQVAGDSWGRLIIDANGKHIASHGSDPQRDMYEYHTNSYMNVLMPMVQQYPMRLFTKAGAINDSDIPGYFGGSLTGMMAYDTTNNRLYIRGSTAWRFVTTT